MRRADQVSRFDTERGGQLDEDLNGWVTSTAFDIADVGPVDPCLKGKVFLAPALGGAQALEIRAKGFADVHPLPIARLSTINLQTISDIFA